jgi:hypothetical protein
MRIESSDYEVIVLKKKCNGYQPEFKESMLVDLPWRHIIELKEKTWCVDPQRDAFHSLICYQNSYLFETSDNDQIVCLECSSLKYNTQIKNIMHQSVNYNSNINNKYLSMSQKEYKLKQKDDHLNQVKMSTLNNLKKIYFLTNQQNDYQRLINLLSQNDIGGVHRLIKSCLKTNRGVNGIINTLNKAINGIIN